MTRPAGHPNGAPCWIDLTTGDSERAREFYSGLFGWTAEEPSPEFGGYFEFRKDGLRVAGCMGRAPGQEGPDVWTVHLSTPDARETLRAARARGGSVAVDVMDVADLGTSVLLTDPSGARVGAWQPGSHQGFGIVYENDAPCWFELHTLDYPAALDFYRDVFGWTTEVASDDDQLRYALLKPGTTQLAGIMDETSGAVVTPSPSHWTVYFGVADADAAAARIRELGGTIVMEPTDTPYGRLAAATDCTGAAFNLMQATEAMAVDAPSSETEAAVTG